MGSRSPSNRKAQRLVEEWPTRRISLFAVSAMHLTNLAGPVSRCPARAASHRCVLGVRKTPAYEIQLLTTSETPLMTSSGVGLVGGRPWWEAVEPTDTLLVFASAHVTKSVLDPEMLSWVREQGGRVRRIGSVCAGAFVLAAAALLDGRQATTHWELADALASRHPKVLVDGDRIYTQDGNVWTSAGVSAGLMQTSQGRRGLRGPRSRHRTHGVSQKVGGPETIQYAAGSTGRRSSADSRIGSLDFGEPRRRSFRAGAGATCCHERT